jgi:hypothetical protein
MNFASQSSAAVRELEAAKLDAVSGGVVQGPDGFPGCGTDTSPLPHRPHLLLLDWLPAASAVWKVDTEQNNYA